MACFYPLKQFRTFLDFTLDPPSARIPAILERFGLRRLVHYKCRWSFPGEYATKVLKRSTPRHPGVKIGSKCQQIPLHARVCPQGRHPVIVADTCITREDKGDREGIPHIHPIPQVIRLELFLESG